MIPGRMSGSNTSRRKAVLPGNSNRSSTNAPGTPTRSEITTVTRASFTLARAASKGEAVNLKLSVLAFGCNEGSSLCKIFNFVYNVPITFEEGGLTSVTLGSKAP